MVLFRQDVKNVSQQMFVFKTQTRLHCAVEINIEAKYKSALFPSGNVAIIPVYNPGKHHINISNSIRDPQLFFKHLSRLTSQQSLDRFDSTLVENAKVEQDIKQYLPFIPEVYRKDFSFIVTKFSNVGYIKIVYYYEKELSPGEKFWSDTSDNLWLVSEESSNVKVIDSWRACLMFLIPSLEIDPRKQLSTFSREYNVWL